jgi:hypothetical protein
MIKLREIINQMQQNEEAGLIPLDDWRLSEVDYFTDMGFTQDGQSSMMLNNPEIRVYKKKNITHELARDVQAVGEGYVVEDNTKKKKYSFPTFKKMIEYFDNYEQDFKL